MWEKNMKLDIRKMDWRIAGGWKYFLIEPHSGL
jgi:hypothetical protein